jgi:hypothetical protein
MSSPANPLPPNPDLAAAYQQAYDALGTAYWAASDIDSKDLIHGTQEAIGDILTALDEDQIAGNTDAFIAINAKVKAVNAQLQEIKDSISTITKNINTASTVLAAASKVLSLLPL